jgi:hypothetical protein
VSSPSTLTAEEQGNVRAALRFLHLRFGTWKILAKALRFKLRRLSEAMGGREAISAELVLRVARLAVVSFDDVTAGRYPAPGTCPHCGRVARAD